MASGTHYMSGLLTFIFVWSFVSLVNAQSYHDMYKLQDDLLKNNNYSTVIRPLLNQSEKMILFPYFFLLALVDVDEVQQMIVVNGFMIVWWKDQLLTWNPSSYNGIKQFEADPTSIWRPRLVLLNTMDERDMFEDDYAPLSIAFNGLVSWGPGGLFPALCLLDLRKFPYDEHECYLDLTPMYMDASNMEFDMSLSAVDTSLLIENGEWTLKGTRIYSQFLSLEGGAQNYVVRVTLTIQRKSTFFIINIFIPVLFLCALNVLTFVIPVDSGEKIGFSITVLLAMAVYMDIIGDRLPTNSENMPYMTHYIFFLFTLSVLCCADTIAIVWLHHREEEEEKKQKRQSKLKGMLSKMKVMNALKTKTSGDKNKICPTTPETVASLRDVETVENKFDEDYRAPACGNYTSNSLAHQCDDTVSLNAPTVIQRLKSGVSRTSSARRADLHPAKMPMNRYKNVAIKLNYYSAILFGAASSIMTLVILILIAT